MKRRGGVFRDGFCSENVSVEKQLCEHTLLKSVEQQLSVDQRTSQVLFKGVVPPITFIHRIGDKCMIVGVRLLETPLKAGPESPD